MTRTKSHRGIKIALGIFGALIVLFFILEIGLRMFIAQQIKSDFLDNAPDSVTVEREPTVRFGAMPVLFGLASGKIHHINLDLPSTLTPDSSYIAGTPAATIDATGLALDEDNPHADRVVVNTMLPQAVVRDMLRRELGDSLEESSDGSFVDLNSMLTVSKVQANPESGTFTITFSNGAFAVELRPHIQDGQPVFEAVSTQLLGRTLPDFFSDAVSVALERGLNDQVVGQMKVERFDVVDGGFAVTIIGENVLLNDLQV
ncbi:LmeA family phospholipid-binding protein [Corynebacterium meitnerae]|uniref:DUF2993 domain-containing protein n=1 Tax=Corynebacterium meitnerae TaxID=2913498 RepID=A0A9X3RJS9_9CORY|nr:LmeA family phospholipid-binding protein [Corynebacterium meitnerae]MCZ9294335.1 DUF2993 domain-containing protein [Corynebacterium meitnerae]